MTEEEKQEYLKQITNQYGIIRLSQFASMDHNQIGKMIHGKNRVTNKVLNASKRLEKYVQQHSADTGDTQS